ncbi:2-hydroxyacyl-CoA dehydratase subunit D [Chloroflexota bacterium]
MVTAKGSKGLDKVREICQDRPRRVKELKVEGKKVVGYTCAYAPLEVLTASDLIPYWVFGDMEEPITEADKLLPVSFCPFMRSFVDQVFKGKYDFLDGMVGVHSCDGQEKTMHALKSVINLPLFPYVDVPHTQHEWGLELFKGILSDYKKVVGSFVGKEISADKLKAAIELHNQQRVLVRELYELKKPDPPLISGTETLQVMIALVSIPVGEGNDLLRQVISEVKERKDGPQKKAVRLLIGGSMIDNISLLEMIEEADASVVMDDNCVGSRAYFTDVRLTDDPVDGLAYRYLMEIKCPRTFKDITPGATGKDRMADLKYRYGYLGDYVSQWKVDGVIFLLLRCCDILGYEIVDIGDYLKSIDVPNIYLEHNYMVGELAALRTRVQAFLEMMA